jgi:hypothetical protein
MKIAQQFTRNESNERGQSTVIGFVMVVSLVVISFTMYQSSVIPAQNEEVEFKHSQTVEKEMSRLQGAIKRVSADDVPRSMTISTGVQYPDRALGINPPAPTGTLKTSDPIDGSSEINLKNMRSTDTSPKRFDGDPLSFESKELIYQANYNARQQDPVITIGAGFLFTEVEDGSVLKSESIISGKQINLNLLASSSNYQETGLSADVTVKPVSSSTEYHIVKSPNGAPLTIEIRTSLPSKAGKNLVETLRGKKHVNTASYTRGSPSSIKIELDSSVAYDLRLTKIGFGDVDQYGEYYLSSDDSAVRSLDTGESTSFTVTARDKLGNPVPGTTVSVEDSGPGDVLPVNNAITDDDGRATFRYEHGGGSGSVEFSILNDDPPNLPRERVSYNIDSSTADTDDSDEIGTDIDNGYALDSSRRVVIDKATINGDSVFFLFENRGDVDMKATRVQLNGYVGHFPSGDFATKGTFEGTNVNFNGQTVDLDLKSQFTIRDGETWTAELSSLNSKQLKTGLIILSVEYEYVEDGETKTDTATYSVTVS